MVVRPRLRNGSLGALFVGAGALGCGGTTSEGQAAHDAGGDSASRAADAKAMPVARRDFASQAADAWCTLLSGCCSGAGFPYGGNACRTGFQLTLRDALANQKVAFDEHAAGECIAAVRSAGCEDIVAIDSACRTVINGTVPAGGACATSAECVKPSAGIAFCYSGICNPPHGKAGDPCFTDCEDWGSSIACHSSEWRNSSDAGAVSTACYSNDGLWCGASRTCEPLAAVSQSCGARTIDGHLVYVSCVEGADCDSTTHVCTPVHLLPVGSDCIGGACNDTAYCDSSTGKCTAFKPNGANCQLEIECSSRVCASNVCVQPSVATGRSCAGVF
jgi:hypothetical protein